ncbi:MAG TPA: helix-hairpin-helix domain-containing protein [Polyangia bacterium]
MRRALLSAMLLALSFATARAESVSSRDASPAPVAAKSSEGVVNLNNATEEQLVLLPGIGPSKAKAIAEHRHAHPFHRVDELTKVKGIGRKTFGRLRPYLTIAGPTTLDHDVKSRRQSEK